MIIIYKTNTKNKINYLNANYNIKLDYRLIKLKYFHYISTFMYIRFTAFT